jgi:phosphoserine phosphatase
MSGYFASELEYDNNLTFTGRYIDSECVGDNKAIKIKKFCELNNISMNNSVFYSDSVQDIPLLSMVGFPTGVWPDKMLKQHCKVNNWSIEYW